MYLVSLTSTSYYVIFSSVTFSRFILQVDTPHKCYCICGHKVTLRTAYILLVSKASAEICSSYLQCQCRVPFLFSFLPFIISVKQNLVLITLCDEPVP